mmetsp:Transcript_3619/g.10153  ORF Transcript_3619/g.10153 Transcript_3619/m.10153 type:complete len:84 (+) Transcript_3619:4014-4265(+)
MRNETLSARALLRNLAGCSELVRRAATLRRNWKDPARRQRGCDGTLLQSMLMSLLLPLPALLQSPPQLLLLLRDCARCTQTCR